MSQTRLTWSDRVKAGLWGKLPLAPRNAPRSTPYTLADVGCYVDGSRGIYAIDRIIEIAIEHGMAEPQPCDLQGTHIGCEDFREDECDEYMNAHHAVDGAYWGRSEGDWGLWPIEGRGTW